MNNVCDRVRRKALWLRHAVVATMIIIVLVDVLLVWRSIANQPGAFGILQIEAPASLANHPWLTLIDCVLLSWVYLYGLYRLVLLMRRFERGEFFSIAATHHLRAFAFSLLLGTVAGFLLPPVALAIARLFGLNHINAVTLSLDGSDVWMILISTLFFVIAWIMGEARQLAEDNQLIV